MRSSYAVNDTNMKLVIIVLMTGTMQTDCDLSEHFKQANYILLRDTLNEGIILLQITGISL